MLCQKCGGELIGEHKLTTQDKAIEIYTCQTCGVKYSHWTQYNVHGIIINEQTEEMK